MAKTGDRKKINFMIDVKTLKTLEVLIPSGKRSDFINDAMKEALTKYGRQEAINNIKDFKKDNCLNISTEEIIKSINYGRK